MRASVATTWSLSTSTLLSPGCIEACSAPANIFNASSAVGSWGGICMGVDAQSLLVASTSLIVVLCCLLWFLHDVSVYD